MKYLTEVCGESPVATPEGSSQMKKTYLKMLMVGHRPF